MENEIRYYLRLTQKAMQPLSTDEEHDAATNAICANGDQVPVRKVFEPQYIITATKLPTGAIEVAVNNSAIAEKIEYILGAYDENMCLKTNTEIQMMNLMIV